MFLQKKPFQVIKDKIKQYLINYWERSLDPSQFSFLDKIVFLFLVTIEKVYILIFKVISFFKRIISPAKSFPFIVISVGNLSVGGTGKSVFVQYLINRLKPKKSAVILRGYKSESEKRGDSFLVSDGSHLFYDTTFVGDEAIMMSLNLGVPVVVGSSRVKSCRILDSTIDFVVLDDSYQNNSVQKDFEILLLDARRPFENGHCLPAGRLRENDYSRADIVILTHANYVKNYDILKIKEKLSDKIDKKDIFIAEHSFQGIYLEDRLQITLNDIKGKTVLAFAGIGAFDSFQSSIKSLNFKKVLFKEFGDHHKYMRNDIEILLSYIYLYNIDIIVTTQKDWVKMKIFLNLLQDADIQIYVLRVEFSFLGDDENNFLKRLLSTTS